MHTVHYSKPTIKKHKTISKYVVLKLFCRVIAQGTKEYLKRRALQ